MAAIRILCTACGSKLIASATAMGKSLTCPNCSGKAVVSAYAARTARPGSTLQQPPAPEQLADTTAVPAPLRQPPKHPANSTAAQIRRAAMLIFVLSAFCAVVASGIIGGIDFFARERLRRDAEQKAAAVAAEEAKEIAMAEAREAETKAKADAEAKVKADAEAEEAARKLPKAGENWTLTVPVHCRHTNDETVYVVTIDAKSESAVYAQLLGGYAYYSYRSRHDAVITLVDAKKGTAWVRVSGSDWLKEHRSDGVALLEIREGVQFGVPLSWLTR
jgi:DNA-directed RNA polymerase subunit RPC12/RpoP